MTPGALRRLRAAAQLLAGSGARTPEDVAERLLAVQAQDLGAARLALRARSAGLTRADVGRALDEGSLVRGWLVRGTLHLARREDYPWLLGLTALPRRAVSRRRLAQEGVSGREAERAVAAVGRALAEDGPLTRAELADRLRARGLPAEGQALAHLLRLAAMGGVAVLGPMRDGTQAYALARDRLGAAPPVELTGDDRERALAELARRYLAGHGPALPADLATWAGLPLRDARCGLRALGRRLAELDDGLVDLAGREPPPARLPARLLPAFDPYLLGWRERSFAVPAAQAREVHPGGGVIRPVALVNGKAVGTWTARRRGGGISVELRLFADVTAAAAAALRREASAVAGFEGRPPARTDAPAR